MARTRYKCIKEMYIDKYDEDGFLCDSDYYIVPVGSIWDVDNSKERIVGGRDTIRLEMETKGTSCSWLEILENTLNEYFEKMDGKAVQNER